MVDLKCAYELDPTNSAVKKEMSSIRKERLSAKANEKKRMMKAFSSSYLYSDKEEEERRKEIEKKEREEQERLEKEKRKAIWEEECVEQLKNGKEVSSFEDWEKERLQLEKKEKERKEKERKEAEKLKRQQQRRERSEKKKEESDDSEDELTERELAMLRGYKKTSDGRTTSYFTREQTEKEKELIGCIQPKRLESFNDTSSSSSSIPSSIVAEPPKVGSVWNRAGTTWEEKDTTEWCTDCLRECLSDSIAVHTSSQDNTDNDVTYIARVKGIDSLSGDASVALAGGKKRYIYDFHAALSYEINKDTKVVASGSLKLPDINSAHTAEEELEVEIGKWKMRSEGEGEDDRNGVVDACRDLLVGEVRKSVLKFVERFNANF